MPAGAWHRARRSAVNAIGIGEGLFVTLTLENGGLSLQVDGRQKLALTADSASHFALPAGAGEITFTTSTGGTTYEVRRGNGIVVKGTRMPDQR